MRSAFALRINSGRIILNFGFQESLRTFLKPIFTGGVVKGNGICSAAFCESAALRESFGQTARFTGALAPPRGSCRAATEGLWMEKRKKR